MRSSLSKTFVFAALPNPSFCSFAKIQAITMKPLQLPAISVSTDTSVMKLNNSACFAACVKK